MEFTVRHVSQASGAKPVNQSVTYSDTEGNVVAFPCLSVTVECGAVVPPEPCPVPAMDGCEDTVLIDLGDVSPGSQGRILQMRVTVKRVCPGKRVAPAENLTEVDKNGREYKRG